MSTLRLDVDLDKIAANARLLVDRAAARGVAITGVTKALLGEPRLARALVASGVVAIGDSRVENIERMRQAHINTPMLLVRSPMPSQIDRIVRSDVRSVNTDLDVLAALATSARVCGRIHEVMIMVELGDLREGVMPGELRDTVRNILRLPTLRLSGIGTNLACRSGIEPTDENMGELSRLVDDVEQTFGIGIPTVSGGNSANLDWLTTTADVGRINELRLGESILLGRDPLTRQPIVGLHTDAVTFVAEVIESKRKPTTPRGHAGQSAFGAVARAAIEATGPREIWQTIVAAGRQDIDPDDLQSPDGIAVLAASSDHLILRTDTRMSPGDTVRFEPGYSALLRAGTSPYVDTIMHEHRRAPSTITVSTLRPERTGGSSIDHARPQLSIVRRGSVPTP